MKQRLHLNEALQKAATPRNVEEAKPIRKSTSRLGKKVVAGHFDKAAVKQLKQLALDNDLSLQDMLAEALNDLFQKYQLKPIA